MSIKLTKKDIVWSYAGTILSMSANFIMLPFLIYFLDKDMLGLWYVFVSIGTIATLFDFGFAVTFARNVTYCWSGAKELKQKNVAFADNSGSPNFTLLKKVISTCKFIYFLIAIGTLILLLSIGSWYIWYISNNVNGIRHYIAWGIYSLALFLNLYYGYYVSFLRGVGAIEKVNKSTIFARIIQIFLTILLLAYEWDIIGASIAYLVYGVVFRMSSKHYFYNYEGLKQNLEIVSEQTSKQERNLLIRTVWYNAWREGLISISNYLCNQATTIICSLFFSLSQTGIYSIAVQFALAISTISGTLYMASQPEIQSSYINKDTDRTKTLMSFVVLTVLYIFFVGFIGVWTVMLPIIRFFKSDFNIPFTLFFALCFYHLIMKIRDCYCSYFSSTNRIIYIKAFIFSSIASVLLSACLCHATNWGVWALVIPQIVCQMLFNIWYWPWKAHKDMNLRFSDMLHIGNTRIIHTFMTISKYKN